MLTVEQIKSIAEQGNKELAKIFDQKKVVGGFLHKRILGDSLMFHVHHRDVRVTPHNSPIHLMASLNDDKGGYAWEWNLVGYELKGYGVKPRKIKGKTPEEALKKILAWLKKNSDTIEAVAADAIKKDDEWRNWEKSNK